jgi:hypothetical protein
LCKVVNNDLERETVLNLYSEILNDLSLEKNGISKQNASKLEQELQELWIKQMTNLSEMKLINPPIAG